jgi:phage major head subunit gpT-like protein
MKFDINNQADIDAARIAFHVAFLQQLGKLPVFQLEQLFMEVNSTTSLEQWSWLTDFPSFEEWTGDRIMGTMDNFKLQVRNKDWSSGLKLHQNQFKDDTLGLFSQVGMAGLAEASRFHRTELAAQLLINGFDGAQFPKVSTGLGYDGKFFFSTTHATGSNKLTTALDTNGAGLDAAEILLGSQTSYDGKHKLRGIKGTTLIVGPKLRPIADRLMSSDFLVNTNAANGVPGTGSVSNPYKGRYEVIVEPELVGTYDDYWFLADLSHPWKPLLFQLREAISTSAVLGGQGTSNDSEPRFKRGELWFGAEGRYNVAAFEHRLIVGSLVA